MANRPQISTPTGLPGKHRGQSVYDRRKSDFGILFPRALRFRTEIRFRPHFCPFTEPSFEVNAKAKALGDGLVDPAVFEAVNGSRQDPGIPDIGMHSTMIL